MVLSFLLSALLAASIALPGGPPVGMDYLTYDPATGRVWVPGQGAVAESSFNSERHRASFSSESHRASTVRPRPEGAFVPAGAGRAGIKKG